MFRKNTKISEKSFIDIFKFNLNLKIIIDFLNLKIFYNQKNYIKYHFILFFLFFVF